jgi:hypothetical protein
VSTYTHVSDQHARFDTKVITSTSPESPYALDGILGNQTDLLITEHATDTHGATLANFALFDLAGLQLSPRIRDLGKITLYRTGPRADCAARYPSSGHLLTRRLNEDLITGMWDDLLRVAASVKGGHATGALVVGKLCSSRRQQNALASAIKEYGALRLLRIARRGTGSVVTWRRAQMVLLSAQMMPVAKIAEVTFTSEDRGRAIATPTTPGYVRSSPGRTLPAAALVRCAVVPSSGRNGTWPCPLGNSPSNWFPIARR